MKFFDTSIEKKKVLIALSGGVDSSVSAALLVKEGYDVTAAYMVMYDDPAVQESCWIEEYRDAVRVAASLGIPIVKFDFTKEYREHVLSYLFDSYSSGNTPNPDVLCNTYIKFGVWLDKARELGFDMLATGHYAQVKKQGEEYFLLQGIDDNKDQTYFLHQLNQEKLSRVLFPVGTYTKQRVRELAVSFNLPTAKKKESMGICFVGNVSMKDFLKKHISLTPGNIVFYGTDEVIGRHDGLSLYTIGQSHFGNVSSINKGGDSRSLYVVEKRAHTHELVVGYDDCEKLFTHDVYLSFFHLISGVDLHYPVACKARFRHRQPLQDVVVTRYSDDLIQVHTKDVQRAIVPGQFGVLYKDGVCLGGGVISSPIT
ncbi:MAG: tRNA 2-thiouridine(34) synthase MnmA [Candidatus Magasanikbacteria bacterium]|jgi:tRNA-uridine 2-sulfurtransferase|nr:tRNA 2-thiouridine(34) synthase MnmA [Candidatus Magasanikbacteria bacterium]MBT4221427.1 tRNA 2-thiouridine(34) synthase MnmA [Candidatus Magasanikbacteria bacterium]MBT4350725.1 tRNA 2-thiouridine(34) synthase MnmA [Candidatus Magasanikbacteria bacterium]MBT4541599.1 tRNA 2-thiouridine(34) synthase MnmA [Candidatus Magasanikbacteria bacterium]MBT6252958.1 tRNA 2-thiouridine(34) synthase MnmA [Candidatus Magasanikbacteria bacterium]